MNPAMPDRVESNADRVAKICGADVELGNFITGVAASNSSGKTDELASRLMLAEIPGFPRRGPVDWACNCESCRQRRRQSASLTTSTTHGNRHDGAHAGGDWDPQEVGRRFLPSNGSCFYIDLNHLEGCIPEVRSAREHLASIHAMYRIAAQARQRAASRLARGAKLYLLANNSDGHGQSFGAHLSLMTTRRCWDNVFLRRVHYALSLATFQVASFVLTGQGKVGSENGAPEVDYQISQRADFFETIVAPQTTHRRPIVNSRDEALAGWRTKSAYSWGDSANSKAVPSPADSLARMHVIAYDSNLCHVAGFLKIGLLQIAVAMLEADYVDSTLILESPVEAAIQYSHDVTLSTTARLIDGREMTIVDLLRHWLERMTRFVEREGGGEHVPQAAEILALAHDTAELLAARDFDALAPRLDWVQKGLLLTRAMQDRPELDWKSPGIKQLDHLYASLDPENSLYLAAERDGAVERMADEAEIEHFMENPPADTRAYVRAMLLRRAGPNQVTHVDWDRIDFRVYDEYGRTTTQTIELDDPRDVWRFGDERSTDNDATTHSEQVAETN